LGGLGGVLDAILTVMEASGGLLEASWTSWKRLGGDLGRLGGVLGSLGSVLEAILGVLEASWRP